MAKSFYQPQCLRRCCVYRIPRLFFLPESTGSQSGDQSVYLSNYKNCKTAATRAIPTTLAANASDDDRVTPRALSGSCRRQVPPRIFATHSCCACFVAGEPGGGASVLRCRGRMRRWWGYGGNEGWVGAHGVRIKPRPHYLLPRSISQIPTVPRQPLSRNIYHRSSHLPFDHQTHFQFVEISAYAQSVPLL